MGFTNKKLTSPNKEISWELPSSFGKLDDYIKQTLDSVMFNYTVNEEEKSFFLALVEDDDTRKQFGLTRFAKGYSVEAVITATFWSYFNSLLHDDFGTISRKRWTLVGSVKALYEDFMLLFSSSLLQYLDTASNF